MKVEVASLQEFVYFWALALTLGIVVLSRLYGFGLSNVPAFLVYIVFVAISTQGAPIKSIRFGKILGISIAFFLLASGSIWLQQATAGSLVDYLGRDTFEYAVANLQVQWFYLLLGMLSVFTPNKRLKKRGLTLALIVFLFIFLSGFGVLDYDVISARAGDEVHHIVIAQSVTVLVLLALAYGSGYRPIIMVLGAGALFLSGSRTGFFIGSATMLLYALMVGSISRRPAAILSIALVVLFFFVFVDYESNPLLSRMLLAGGFDWDSSAQSRLRQMEVGFLGLRHQILLGDMNYVVYEFGGIGYYIHNVLGYWQQYGAIVFSVVCLLMLLMANRARKDYEAIRRTDEPFRTFRMLMFVYSALALLLSMSYTFKFFWFVVGLYCVDEIRKMRAARSIGVH